MTKAALQPAGMRIDAAPRVWDAAGVEAFDQMVRQDGHFGATRYTWNASQLFGSIDLRDKRVLEVGSGGGLRTVFMAMQGARSVVSLEPGLAGSRASYQQVQRQRLQALALTNVEFVDADFNLWDAAGSRFDVIVSESSINHLYESPHHALRHEETYRRYLDISRKMWSLLAPGGVACISDACRWGLFSLLRPLGVKRPWTGKRVSAIWRIHQNPWVWRRILMDAGFSRVDVRYPRPYRLRRLGPFVANPVANYFLRAQFYLRAWR